MWTNERSRIAMLPRRLSNVGDDIAGQATLCKRDALRWFPDTLFEGRSKVQALALNYTSSQVDDLQLPLRKANDIITTIVSHFILNLFFFHFSGTLIGKTQWQHVELTTAAVHSIALTACVLQLHHISLVTFSWKRIECQYSATVRLLWNDDNKQTRVCKHWTYQDSHAVLLWCNKPFTSRSKEQLSNLSL